MTASSTANFKSITGDLDFLPLLAGVAVAAGAGGEAIIEAVEAAAALRPRDADRADGIRVLDADADRSILDFALPVFSAAFGVGFLFRVDPDLSMVELNSKTKLTSIAKSKAF